MLKTDARGLLELLAKHRADWLRRRGADFVRGELIPAIGTLESSRATARDQRLLCAAHSHLGDLYDLLDAPRAAARAYRAAIRWDPDDGWAWTELGNMLLKVGHYRASLRALRRAGQLVHDGVLHGIYVREAAEGLSESIPPSFEDGAAYHRPAPSWDVCERLASGRPHAALRLLGQKRRPYLRQLRARVYGALGDSERLIHEWQLLAEVSGEIELEYGDWFFLPRAARADARLWKALYAMRQRFVHGWWETDDALWEIVPEPRRVTPGSAASVRRLRRRVGLSLRLEIARTERDATGARRLASRYPDWPRARRLARQLARSR